MTTIGFDKPLSPWFVPPRASCNPSGVRPVLSDDERIPVHLMIGNVGIAGAAAFGLRRAMKNGSAPVSE